MWQNKALLLHKQGYSGRKIAVLLDQPKSTVNDFLQPFRVMDGGDEVKILVFDIETAPMEIYGWSLWDKFTPTDMIIHDWTVLTWSAKWVGNDTMMRASVSPSSPRDDFEVVEALWQLFDEADIVVAHNGDKFDIKKMNARFFLSGLPEPSSYRSVDTLKIAKRKFAFTSNRLDYISKITGGPGKVSHEGFNMWRKCLDGDAEALQAMQDYNDGDVIELERIYLEMRGWDHLHPNLGVYSKSEEMICPNCGSDDVEPTGKFRTTQTAKYATHRCGNCGKISHSGQATPQVKPREALVRPSK